MPLPHERAGPRVEPGNATEAYLVALVTGIWGSDAKTFVVTVRSATEAPIVTAISREVLVPRQIAMYLMREETDVSLLRIGAELGGRDHSTVLHACDKITREVAVNDELRREIAAVRELIYSD